MTFSTEGLHLLEAYEHHNYYRPTADDMMS